MSAIARVVRLHAHHLLRAAERRATAERLRDIDPDRAEMAADEAAEHLATANALRDVLALHPDVHAPDERQLSLLSDGGTP
jgi:hypothetical protein